MKQLMGHIGYGLTILSAFLVLDAMLYGGQGWVVTYQNMDAFTCYAPALWAVGGILLSVSYSIINLEEDS